MRYSDRINQLRLRIVLVSRSQIKRAFFLHFHRYKHFLLILSFNNFFHDEKLFPFCYVFFCLFDFICCNLGCNIDKMINSKEQVELIWRELLSLYNEDFFLLQQTIPFFLDFFFFTYFFFVSILSFSLCLYVLSFPFIFSSLNF